MEKALKHIRKTDKLRDLYYYNNMIDSKKYHFAVNERYYIINRVAWINTCRDEIGDDAVDGINVTSTILNWIFRIIFVSLAIYFSIGASFFTILILSLSAIGLMIVSYYFIAKIMYLNLVFCMDGIVNFNNLLYKYFTDMNSPGIKRIPLRINQYYP